MVLEGQEWLLDVDWPMFTKDESGFLLQLAPTQGTLAHQRLACQKPSPCATRIEPA
jgi:hypothetical protein